MTLVGYGVQVAIPVISSARVEYLGFSEEQVGRLAGADLGGLAVGAIIASWFMSAYNRRLLAALGALFAIMANALCIPFVQYEPMVICRGLAGLGSGLYTAVAVANLGATSKPARAYNLMLFAFAFSQALEMHVLPMLSINQTYIAFIGAYLLGLPALRWMPARTHVRQLDVTVDLLDHVGHHHRSHHHVPAYLIVSCLVAIFLTYVNIGGYWTYIELAALDAKVAATHVDSLLVWSSLASVSGCLLATWFSDRFGLIRPLLAALLLMSASVALLSPGIDASKLSISVTGFNLLWIFVDVYQMGFIANADHSGAFSALIPAAQGLGQIVGPNLAASLLAHTYGYGAVFTVCAAFALSGLLIYLAVYLRLRRLLPALADTN
jgi:predicted MFS family arabinose efflux permease